MDRGAALREGAALRLEDDERALDPAERLGRELLAELLLDDERRDADEPRLEPEEAARLGVDREDAEDFRVGAALREGEALRAGAARLD